MGYKNESIEAMKGRVEEILRRMDEAVIEGVKNNESAVLKMNTEDQLYNKGVDNAGAFLAPPYAISTKKRKQRRGQRYDHVTLRDTEDFHRTFYIGYNEKSFEIKGSIEYAKHLEKRYGVEIYGLTDENIAKLGGMIKEGVQEEIKKIIT